MNATTRARALWRDWCAATGHDPSQTTEAALGRFSAQVPGTNPALVPLPADLDAWKVPERRWASVETSLARCPAFGWPLGVTGRRDAWLIVAARVLRLRRSYAVGLRAHDLPALLDRLPEPVHGHPCLRCVAHRWLDVVQTYEQWSRSAVRGKVHTRPPGTWSPAIIGSAVPCDGACQHLSTLVSSIPRHTVVSPAIDRHGWWNHWRPLSPRALTAVLASRCDPSAAAPSALTDDPMDLFRPPAAQFDDTTFERLDAAIDAADALNSRLEALLSEFGG